MPHIVIATHLSGSDVRTIADKLGSSIPDTAILRAHNPPGDTPQRPCLGFAGTHVAAFVYELAALLSRRAWSDSVGDPDFDDVGSLVHSLAECEMTVHDPAAPVVFYWPSITADPLQAN
jgi:hypothetical protein